MARFARLLLIVASIVLIVLTIARVCVSWKNDSYLLHPSGGWIALAWDLKDGIFFRPLYESHLYGGVRFFPLHYALHALLIKLGLNVLTAGYTLTFLSGISLIFGVFTLLRCLNVSPVLATISTVLVFAASSAQEALLTIRVDLLAAALNVLGVIICVNRKLTFKRILASAVFFSLAFAAKPTTIFGLAAVCLFLLFASEHKQAFSLLITTLVGYTIVMLIMIIASHGRALEVIRVVYTSGSGLLFFLKAPFRLIYVGITLDPVHTFFLIFSIASVFTLNRLQLLEFPSLLFITSLAGTVVIFGGTGISSNNLLDLHIACIVLIAFHMEQKKIWAAEFGPAILAIVTLFALMPIYIHFRDKDSVPHRSNYLKAIQVAQQTGKPMLSENPLLPTIAGERAYILDPHIFANLNKRENVYAEPLLQNLRHKYFGAVILMRDAATNKRWYEETHFGPRFRSELLRSYTPTYKFGMYRVYTPR